MATEQGLSLADIGPATEDVTIGANKITFQGVSAEDILELFLRFPNLRKLVPGGGGFKADDLIAFAPTAIASIIAAGHGELGNEKAEQAARKFGVEAQLDIIEAIGRLTFKNGFGPFVKRLVALSDAAVSLNSGRVTDTPSQPALKPSSPEATTQEPSGS